MPFSPTLAGIGGGGNTYIPSAGDIAAGGALQVEFTRSINSFGITQYAQIVPVSKMTGYYLYLDNADNARVVNGSDYQWGLGDEAPVGETNQFDFLQYATNRFAYAFSVPTETNAQAAWDVVAQHSRSKAQVAMTHRTLRAATALTSSNNWLSNAYAATATSWGSGPWSGGTEASPTVQPSIQKALQIISLNTGGAVSPKDIYMVISPDTALALSQSAEVRAYVKNYPAAASFLQGSDIFSRWGIPPTLFGLGGVVVDESVRVTTRKGATEARSFVYGDGAYFVSRPGGLVGVEGSASFSTLTLFAYEDMTVESKTDEWNRRISGRVVDNSALVVTAPVSGVAIADTSV